MSLYAPKPPPFDGLSPLTGLAGLDARARDIFRRIVESYLETGEPVGSRTLSLGGVALSPASIRNTMQDLTLAGLLVAPHTSAGRIPTHAGLRLFVDGLLEIGDLTQEERREIDGRLAGRGRNFEAALDEASNLLSGLAGGAGVVSSPVRDAGVKHVEFVALGGDQALAVLVADDDRTIRTVLTQALTRAGCRVHATGSLGQLMRWVEEGRGDEVVAFLEKLAEVAPAPPRGLDSLFRGWLGPFAGGGGGKR